MIKIYKACGYFVLSENKVWLPGHYDSERTATIAIGLSDAMLSAMIKKICNINGESRAITSDDILKWLGSVQIYPETALVDMER